MLKEDLYQHCLHHFLKKLNDLEAQKELLSIALNSESKSSAGDKHETGRAMIQLEREKLGGQMAKAETDYKKLLRFNNKVTSNQVALGTVVITNEANYYIAVSAKSYVKMEETYYCISPQSPIGALLLGKKVGDVINFNKSSFTLLEIH